MLQAHRQGDVRELPRAGRHERRRHAQGGALPAQALDQEGTFAGCRPCPRRRARRVRFGQHVRPGRTRAYARGGLWRGHVARQSCLLSGTPKGVSGVPVPNGMLRRVVGGSWLGMGRIWGFEGGSENCPLASGTCNDKTEEFSTK